MDSSRVHWTVDDDAIKLIEDWAPARGRGELVSEIIRNYGTIRSYTPTPDLDCGVSEKIVQRLTLIEQRIAMLQMQLDGHVLPVIEVGDNDA